jgi:hypothetical protein
MPDQGATEDNEIVYKHVIDKKIHLFYLNWHAASQLNCYEFLQQMTRQNFKH